MSLPDVYGYNNFPACGRTIATPQPIIQPNHFTSIRLELKNSSGAWVVYRDMNYSPGVDGIDMYIFKDNATRVVAGVSYFDFKVTYNTLFQNFTPKYFNVSARFVEPYIPTFSFATSLCSGSTAPVLPTTSSNTPAITGTWSPITVSNTATGTYSFTPTAGQCAATKSVTITVTPKVIPIFTQVAAICSGALLSALPTSSTNTPAITGTWSPATVSNTATGTYTFTPTAGQCANTTSMTITVTPNVIPTFTQVAAICNGASLSALPTSSTNTPAITGTWSPALNNAATTTYLFTPTAGQFANTTSMTITVTTVGCGNSCNPPLILTSETNTGVFTYQNRTSITTQTSYDLSATTQDITMKARDFILMQPNTHIAAGVKYLAKIEACTLDNGGTITHINNIKAIFMCYKNTAQISPSIFDYAHVMLNGVPALASQIQFYYDSGDPLPAGVSLNPDGTFSVAANTAVSIMINVRVCTSSSNCSANLLNVGFYVNYQIYASDEVTNVWFNDTLVDSTNRTNVLKLDYIGCPRFSAAMVGANANVILTPLAPLTVNGWSIDQATGLITHPASPPYALGTTILSYKICDLSNTYCSTAIQTINVIDARFANRTTVTKEQATAIASEFMIYPNPTHDAVTISSEDVEMSYITITSFEGKVVYSQATDGHFKDLSLSLYSNGVYMLTVETKNGVRFTKKLIKK